MSGQQIVHLVAGLALVVGVLVVGMALMDWLADRALDRRTERLKRVLAEERRRVILAGGGMECAEDCTLCDREVDEQREDMSA